ncbi:MFS transporter [Sedimentibacter sp.]|uniref:MFS transporter n=1 Tax=Sedimentibacter sp. TaxID=1960295 RepID=UPI002896E4C1|nr:MFS transporter [Sedimentibacter sp.]
MKKASIGRLYLCFGLFALCSSMGHPVTPTMFIEKGFADYVFGLSFAAMSLCYFFGSLIWGTVGDNYGHIKVMAFTGPVYGVTQLIFGMTDTVFMTIAARLAGGFFSAGIYVCSLAYLVNVTDQDNRGRHISYYVALTSVLAAFGYFVGGVVGNFSIRFVFVLQASLIFIYGILTYLLIEEVRSDDRFTAGMSLNPFKSYSNLIGEMPKILITFLIAVFLTSFASTAYDNAFNYYLKDALNLSSSYNGIIKAIIGIVTLIVNFTVNIYIEKHFNPRMSMIIVLLLCGISSLSVTFIPYLYPFFIANIIFFMFNAIYLPIQQDIVTRGQNSKTSGIISGIFNSVRAGGMIFGSLFSGFIYELGSTLPFLSTAVVFFISAFISIINLKQEKSGVNYGITN